jgi:hypothetical protein
MKLYVCYGTFPYTLQPGGHPCGNAYRALKDAGYDPEVVVCRGLGYLPAIFNQVPGRQEVKRLTGKYWVPVLETDDGEAIRPSKEIVKWARENPAPAKHGSDEREAVPS